jgi:hypothetical protein
MPDMNDEDQLSNRAAKRDSLMLAADLFDAGGHPIGRARVRNLSATGLMAECDMPLCDGDRIELVLRGLGRIPGTISWARGGRIGVAFDTEIDPGLARRPIASGREGVAAQTGYAPTRFSRPPR